MIPPVGSRFLYEHVRVVQPMRRDDDGQWVLEKSGAMRVWEFVESAAPGSLRHPSNAHRQATDLHLVRILSETGFSKSDSYGVGREVRVSDRWFEKETLTRIQ